MQGNALKPDTSQPSPDEFRRMLKAKRLKKERERERLGRKTTKFLIVGALVLVGAVWFFPEKKKPKDPAAGIDPDVAAKAAQIQQQLSNPLGGGELNPGQGTVESDSRRGDLQFAMNLIRYIQPEVPRTNPPATPPARKAAGDQ